MRRRRQAGTPAAAVLAGGLNRAMFASGPSITATGIRAIRSSSPLFVRDLSGRWAPALPGTRERAARMDLESLWIYGVETA